MVKSEKVIPTKRGITKTTNTVDNLKGKVDFMMNVNPVTGVRTWNTFADFQQSVKDAAEGKIAPISIHEMAMANDNWGVTFDMEDGHAVIDEESLYTEEHERKMKEWDESLTNFINEALSGLSGNGENGEVGKR